MKKIKHLLILGILLLAINACKKGGSPPPIDPVLITPEAFAQNNFGSTVNRDFIGQTVDITNNPISNVSIKIGSTTVQTDANGIFVIKNASVYEKFAYITATKIGFINGSKAVVPTAGTNNIKIILLPASVTATVNTGAASNVSLTNGTKINFDGNFKTDAGVTYNGTVSVIVNHLDPSDANMEDKMPGMLFAQATNGNAKVLETYGMVNVELKGSSGEKLQPATTAQIEFPITVGQQANAPATIPLWHFDEVNGYWKEDGTATKTGNKYVGSVKHFSWWNVDYPYEMVLLKIKIVDQNGNAIPNLRTTLSDSYPSNTDNNGNVIGFVPKNTTYILKIYTTSACSTLINTQTIGPFTTDTTLPNIVVNTTTLPSTVLYKTITGSLKKCDNSNVTNGYVSLVYDYKTYIKPVTNGTFSFNILSCNTNSFTIIGQDLDNSQNSGTLSSNLNASIVNMGTLTTCQSTTESIVYSIDGGLPVYLSSNFLTNVLTNSFVVEAGLLNTIRISGNSITPGIYSTQNGFQISGFGLSPGGYQNAPTYTMFNITYNVINIGSIGQYIDITFNGTYRESTMTQIGMGQTFNRSINGTAHIIRR